MKHTTVHQAKTHFSKILAQVETGDEVLVCRGTKPVAKIVPYRGAGRARPQTGTITSKPVTYAEDCFAPLTDAELKEWGL